MKHYALKIKHMVFKSSFLEREKDQLDLGRQQLEQNRKRWKSITKKQIQTAFKTVIEESRRIEYPYNLGQMTNDSNKNEETIQLDSRINPTDVVLFDGGQITPIYEKDCRLVASLCATGTVTFMMTPYKSDRHSMREDDIILEHRLIPERVSDRLIQKQISSFLFYSRFTSLYGISQKTNFFDLTRYYWLLLRDIRNREKLIKKSLIFLNESWKILLAGIVGYIVATLTK